jgi:hypothetical protein
LYAIPEILLPTTCRCCTRNIDVCVVLYIGVARRRGYYLEISVVYADHECIGRLMDALDENVYG